MMADTVYMVFVNLGSLDHPLIYLHKADESHDFRYVDASGDHMCEVGEVDRGVIDKHGHMYYITSDVEEAEAVQSGIYMVRRMLRNWVDS